ncbi:hypothetical protein GW17_00013239 [Ensete ventricosum]|nr:hypothetical protein GW17_00013239 [Ensete ventricosum]
MTSRRLPLPVGSGPYGRRRCPYRRQPWPWAVAPYGLAIGAAPCRRRAASGCHPYRLAAAGHPLYRGPWSQPVSFAGPWPQSAAPLHVARSWPTTPVGGLAVASHPYKWPSHGRLLPFLVAFVAKMQ